MGLFVPYAVPIGLYGAGLGIIAMVMVGGCADPVSGPMLPPAEVEITIEPAAGARLCAGTEAWAQDEFVRVQAQTELEPAYDLTVTVGAGAVAEHCTDSNDPQQVLGCTVGEGAVVAVYTTAGAFSHELVHALRRHNRLSTQAMFEEGFAELVNGSDAYPRYVDLDPSGLAEVWQPEAQVQLDARLFRDGNSYRIATHFLDFVAAEHGDEALTQFMRSGIDASGDEAIERFERHFGVPLTERAESWRGAGSGGRGRGSPCIDGSEPVPEQEAVLRVTVDCDAADTMGLGGPEELAWQRRCLTVPMARRYTMALEADSGVVRWEVVPGSCAEDSSVLYTAPALVEVGEPVSFGLGACTWALTFESSQGEPEAFELMLRPD